MDDVRLLQEYATRNSEAAFEHLVVRHINLVYSTALRLWASDFGFLSASGIRICIPRLFPRYPRFMTVHSKIGLCT